MAKRKAHVKELNRIKAVLDDHNKTQAWLAGELDVEFRTVNRYINNHRQPSLARLFEIAEVIGVNARDLINEKPFVRRT